MSEAHVLINKGLEDISVIKAFATQASTPEELEQCRTALLTVLESFKSTLNYMNRTI